MCAIFFFFFFFWPAPLAVHSVIHRHQPAQRTVLGQVDCFIQCEVVGSQITLDSVQPRDTRTPWWSLPVSGGGAVSITLASASSSICAVWPDSANKMVWWLQCHFMNRSWTVNNGWRWPTTVEYAWAVTSLWCLEENRFAAPPKAQDVMLGDSLLVRFVVDYTRSYNKSAASIADADTTCCWNVEQTTGLDAINICNVYQKFLLNALVIFVNVYYFNKRRVKCRIVRVKRSL